MFLEILTYKEKEALFQLLLSVAKADENFTKEEADYISNSAQSYGINVDIDSKTTIKESCAKLKSPNAKTVTIQEIVKIAIVDDHYDDTERQAIIEIANILEVPSDKFKDIEDWVIEGQKWVQKGENMLIFS